MRRSEEEGEESSAVFILLFFIELVEIPLSFFLPLKRNFPNAHAALIDETLTFSAAPLRSSLFSFLNFLASFLTFLPVSSSFLFLFLPPPRGELLLRRGKSLAEIRLYEEWRFFGEKIGNELTVETRKKDGSGEWGGGALSESI